MSNDKHLRVAPTHGIEHREIARLTERVAELEAGLLRAHNLYCGCLTNQRVQGKCWAAELLNKGGG